ncbi:MAG: methyltransferase, partial [Anaerolineaceae bacterium]|nr:methyltransferase [Anaerolineaceae bacterium]
AQLLRLLDGDAIDFLFIDGDHRYEAVRRDFQLYSPLLRPGGIVAFHDILQPPRFPDNQVELFWGELKKDYRTKELVDPADERGWGQWGGIGVVYIR